MAIKFIFVVFLLVTYQKYANSFGDQNFGLCEFFKVLSLDQIDLCQNTRKINFLQKEIKIPDGVSDVVVFEIKQILSDYENRMLKLIQDLISCDGSSSQYEKYLRIYNQMKEIEMSLREAPKNLKQRFINQADFSSKNSKIFFDVFQIFNQALDIIKDVSILLNFQVNVMKPGKPPSTDSPGSNKPENNTPANGKPENKPEDKVTDKPADVTTNKPTESLTDKPTDRPTDATTDATTEDTSGGGK